MNIVHRSLTGGQLSSNQISSAVPWRPWSLCCLSGHSVWPRAFALRGQYSTLNLEHSHDHRPFLLCPPENGLSQPTSRAKIKPIWRYSHRHTLHSMSFSEYAWDKAGLKTNGYQWLGLNPYHLHFIWGLWNLARTSPTHHNPKWTQSCLDSTLAATCRLHVLLPWEAWKAIYF